MLDFAHPPAMYVGALATDGADCRVRTELSRELDVLGRLRATVGAGVASMRERESKFALSTGLGFDVLRFERACRKGAGFFPETPILHTSLGPWGDVVWSKGEPVAWRGGVQAAFGKNDDSLLTLPLWEIFAIVGVSHAERTTASFSLGGRYVVLQGEARIDVEPSRPVTFFMLFGAHADFGAYRRGS